ncbi:MAG: hypothetical protein LAO21_10290 [Acidobacteriia bacterium]|nr:hypothetical protein [Terriglobia bacterium]
MRSGVLLLLLLGNTLPSFVVAQTTPTAKPPNVHTRLATPGKGAHIVRFYATSEDESSKSDAPSGPGPLHIIYSDGSQVEIPKERGRFGDPEHPLTQDNFSNIQLADDRQHLGWLAEYMMCSQSYPCPMELVVYQAGHKLTYLFSSYGVIWSWTFLKGGKCLAMQYGFPHGDETGAFALYDTDTGRVIAQFSSKTKKEAPHWVQQLLMSNK